MRSVWAEAVTGYVCPGCGCERDWSELREEIVHAFARRGISARTIQRVLNKQERLPEEHIVFDTVKEAVPILHEVSEKHDVTLKQMQSQSRTKDVVLARQEAMYRLRKETDLPLKAIGWLLGNRDHSTVIHAVQKVERLSA